MNCLFTHECSGRVREEFRKLGHKAWSCDLKHAEDSSPFHIQGDAINAINAGCPTGGQWHLIGMHPDCTYLTVAGIHWNNRGRGWEKTEAAMAHVHACIAAATSSGAKWYMENPVSIISTKYRKPEQIIQPYQFGDDASKQTCLWLSELPRLTLDPMKYVQPRLVCGKCKRHADISSALRGCSCGAFPEDFKPRWANQTDSGQNRLGPSATRAAERARTYPGIARSMAAAWGNLVVEDWS